MQNIEFRYNTLDIKLLVIIKAFWKWRHYLTYILCSTEVFTNHLNYRYLTTKIKLNGKETRWIEELTTFNFMIIYYKRVKNPVNGLFWWFDFKDNNKLSTTKRQPLSNFLSKFQKHLEGVKNDLIEEQSIDSGEIPLLGNVLSLVEAP